MSLTCYARNQETIIKRRRLEQALDKILHLAQIPTDNGETCSLDNLSLIAIAIHMHEENLGNRCRGGWPLSTQACFRQIDPLKAQKAIVPFSIRFGVFAGGNTITWYRRTFNTGACAARVESLLRFLYRHLFLIF